MSSAQAAVAREVVVTIPMSLCPMSLSKNGRAHWRTRAEDFRNQKQWVLLDMMGQSLRTLTPLPQWESARMTIEWRYSRGRAPDSDNIVARVAGARDAFEAAGIVADDKDITIGLIGCTKVPVGQEEVRVALRPSGAGED